MDYQINRFVIEIPDSDEKTSTDQLDMDFFLQKDYRKVILGTVRFPDGEPAPCSVVKIFKLKHPHCDAEITSELEPIGHAITDDNGQFLLGPLYPGDKIVLKILYLNGLVYEPSSKSVKSTCEPMDTEYEEEE
ncbi:hypothetical protein N4T77_12435 [Clostridium sp. CX1]|uniref:Carboxypeptidase regulatory-like domain-containing protein n=1 Tax=Clostridium tanneri TaxID=3037988 RepID=A0ABU4JQX3_9CLOT|nr:MULTISPECIES: hypothetical protein [unclassified Clostridium]MCT8977410.1 hypothetical protein [Clostridium sp. CX1]MDW8800545.1 hypothetical protein [Clostridium sp. A1-XYC3]